MAERNSPDAHARPTLQRVFLIQKTVVKSIPDLLFDFHKIQVCFMAGGLRVRVNYPVSLRLAVCARLCAPVLREEGCCLTSIHYLLVAKSVPFEVHRTTSTESCYILGRAGDGTGSAHQGHKPCGIMGSDEVHSGVAAEVAGRSLPLAAAGGTATSLHERRAATIYHYHCARLELWISTSQRCA